ncbi:MAG: HEAT repeat domain-containing protein [Bacteroidales bacterium]
MNHRIRKTTNVLTFLLLVPLLYPLDSMAKPDQDSLLYRVQVAARYGQPLNRDVIPENLCRDYTVYEGQHLGWFKYTVGYAPSFDSALRMSRYISDEFLIHSPFVVKYIFGERIPIDRLYYKIQIAASYKKPLYVRSLKRKYGIGPYIPVAEEYYPPYYRYTTGGFASYEEARAFLRDFRRDYGIDGAFIVPYLNGHRIREQDSVSYLIDNEAYINRLPSRPEMSEVEEPADTVETHEGISGDTAVVMAGDTVIREDTMDVPVEERAGGPRLAEKDEEDPFREGIRDFLDTRIGGKIAEWGSIIIDHSYKSILIIVFSFVVCFLLINLVIVFLFIILNKIHREYINERVRTLRNKYQEYLTNYLFNGEENGSFRKLEMIRGSFKRQVLTDEILHMYSNVSGEADVKMRELYFRLKLDEDSVRKIHRYRWTAKTRAIRELARMNVTRAAPLIEKYINSKNDTLRIEAHIAMVRMHKDDPFSFLDKINDEFTRWEQLNVHAIARLYDISIPSFNRWFDRDNDSVVIFALRMAVIYQQTDHYSDILDLTSHPSEKVRKEAIIAIGNMQLREGISRLILIYPTEPYNNQLEILKALYKIPEVSEIEFLVERTREEDFDLQLEAMKVLNKIGWEGQYVLEELEKRYNDEAFSRKVKHVTDKRI